MKKRSLRDLRSALVYTRARRWDPATPLAERLVLDQEIARLERAIARKKNRHENP